MIRVFPRRTKWTPTDELAFIGDPPLFRPDDPAIPVRISCVFSWDIPEALRLERSWGRFYSDVQVGGPAFEARGGDFVPGRFVKPGVTITSRGCSKNCVWCLVPKREGWIRELPIRDGWDVADNNLLACSHDHIYQVFDMLEVQTEPIRFSGGLDAEIFNEWHADLLSGIRLKFAWFACDYPGAVPHLEKVASLLSDFSIEKKRCYVLLGHNGENPAQAEKRLEKVYRLGFLPFAMLYRGPGEMRRQDPEWSKLVKKWTRPGAYRAAMSGRRAA